MHEPIELAIETADGIVDCRLEPVENNGIIIWSATILYPHNINGRLQSRVYEHNLNLNPQTGLYYFADEASVHPKVLLLGKQLSDAICIA